MYRLCDEDWNNADPNKDEAHIRSTAVDVHQYRLKVHQMRIEITDVGGQRSEPVGAFAELQQEWVQNGIGMDNQSFRNWNPAKKIFPRLLLADF